MDLENYFNRLQKQNADNEAKHQEEEGSAESEPSPEPVE